MNKAALITYIESFSEEEDYMFLHLLGLRIPELSRVPKFYLDFPGGKTSDSTYTRKTRKFKAKLKQLLEEKE